MRIPSCTNMTLKASPLSNRGFDRREYPRFRRPHTNPGTLTGCPISHSHIPLIVLHTTLPQQRYQFITSGEFPMMFFLIDDILYDTLLVSLRVGEGTISLLPFHELREAFTVSRHIVVGSNFEVVYKRCHCYRWVQSYKHVYVVWHAIDAIKNALMIFAEAINVHVEVTLMRLCNRCCTLVSTENYVVDEFCISHILLLLGHPFGVRVWGALVRGCSLRSYPRSRGYSLRSNPRLLSVDAFSVLRLQSYNIFVN